jgi:hypothetical protein
MRCQEWAAKDLRSARDFARTGVGLRAVRLTGRDEPGTFGVALAAKAPAGVWEATRTASGAIANLAKKQAYVSHDSFHIMDRQWGHVTIKMSGQNRVGQYPVFAGRVRMGARVRETLGSGGCSASQFRVPR